MELKQEEPIPAVGMMVRIYGRTNEGVKLLARNITKIDLKNGQEKIFV